MQEANQNTFQVPNRIYFKNAYCAVNKNVFCPLQIKLAFFVAIVGVVLTVLGVGTEFWVELATPKHFYNNQVQHHVFSYQDYQDSV